MYIGIRQCYAKCCNKIRQRNFAAKNKVVQILMIFKNQRIIINNNPNNESIFKQTKIIELL